MHAKTNDELVEMIYDGNDKDDEALQQLIHNLIPMMLKLGRMYLGRMLMYGKEASNRKQEIDRQHYTIPNQRPKDKHCGKI